MHTHCTAHCNLITSSNKVQLTLTSFGTDPPPIRCKLCVSLSPSFRCWPRNFGGRRVGGAVVTPSVGRSVAPWVGGKWVFRARFFSASIFYTRVGFKRDRDRHCEKSVRFSEVISSYVCTGFGKSSIARLGVSAPGREVTLELNLYRTLYSTNPQGIIDFGSRKYNTRIFLHG